MLASAVYLRPKHARTFTYSQNYQDGNLIGTTMHLLMSPTPGLCSNPGHQSKGHRASRASWMVCLSRSKPHSGWCTNDLSWALLVVVVAFKSCLSHQTIGQPSQNVVCGGYSFATVVNEGSMENPQSPSSICMTTVGRQSGGQQCLQKAALVGSIERICL